MDLESTRIKNMKRGPESSAAFNKMMGSLQRDTVSLFNHLNSNEEAISKNMDVLMRENHFYQVQLKELENQLAELQERYSNEGYGKNQMKVQKSFFNMDGFILGERNRQAYIDLENGMAFPQLTDITSKLSYETENGEIFLPDELKLYIKESNDTVALDETNNEIVYEDINNEDLDAVVDRDATTYWMRTVEFNEEDCVTELYGEMDIKMPVRNLNNLYSNVLTMNPYPEGSMTIEDIYYRGREDQWDRLPNLPTKEVEGKTVPIPIKNAQKLLFSFPKTEITELRIKYSQPYWFQNNNKRAFTYGFQDIDLQYCIYSEKSTEFITELKTQNDEQYFKTIHSPKAIPADISESNLNDLVSHQLYYDSNLSTEFEFDSNIIAPLNTVYIKTTLKKEGDKVPVLKGLEFNYEFKTNQIVQ